MITLRKSQERGYADHGWLLSHYSFSFASYQDPQHMGWGNLRVINDDHIAAGGGFATHPHRDMEIISYVMAGALSHQDSLGNASTIRPGEVQRMSAGTGVRHSEANVQSDASTHLFQIWIIPDVMGVAPSYEQKSFAPSLRQGRLALLVSPDGAQGSLSMHADARLWGGNFEAGQSAQMRLDSARKAYVMLLRGSLVVNGLALQAGDAALLADEAQIELSQGVDAEVLVFALHP